MSKGKKPKNLNESFNNLIEEFCESLVLYRELFKKNQNLAKTVEKSALHKSIFESKNNIINSDPKKFIHIFEQIIEKILSIKHAKDEEFLKSKFKEEIKTFSKYVTFLFEEMRVFHGDITQYQTGGAGHLLDLKENFEYFGRIKNQNPSGKGQKWIPSAYSVQGYFQNGKLCGYGQKQYLDGSIYR